MDTTLSYLICLSCLPQIVHTSRERAVLNVMGQHTVDQDTAAGCCAGRLQCFVDACRSCGRHADKSGRRCLSTDASAWQDGRRGHLCDALREVTGLGQNVRRVWEGTLYTSGSHIHVRGSIIPHQVQYVVPHTKLKTSSKKIKILKNGGHGNLTREMVTVRRPPSGVDGNHAKSRE